MHLDPRRLITAVGDEANLDQLANGAGLEPRVLREAWRAERRLDRPALQRLATAFQLSDTELTCHKETYSACPACDAANEIDDRLLGPAAERVTAFLLAARRSVPALRRGALLSTPQAWTASPELFASSPEFAAAATALRRLGGDLTADDLAKTGVAALLGSEERFDPQTVGADLARYAARGDIECLDLMGLNACYLPDGPIPVAGWDLVSLGRSGVRNLMPVPAAADFAPRPGWDLTAAAATWWLRRSTGRKARRGKMPLGLLHHFLTRALHEYAVEPLMVLALADDAPLQPLSYYIVECGVAVHHIRGKDVDDYFVPYGPGEKDMGPHFPDQDYYMRTSTDRPREEWLHFCEVVGPMVERAYQKAIAGHRGDERFTRAARHFLDAVIDAESHAAPQHRTILELSVALEVLVVFGDSELSLQFRNGAAWLGGRDDVEREAIRKLAKALYAAGSAYRHGGKLVSLYDSRDPQPALVGRKDERKSARRRRLASPHSTAVAARARASRQRHAEVGGRSLHGGAVPGRDWRLDD
ncbi:MAG: hypothetical protein ACRDTT_14170 [Pseudonocardiaceae bacterium]